MTTFGLPTWFGRSVGISGMESDDEQVICACWRGSNPILGVQFDCLPGCLGRHLLQVVVLSKVLP